MSDFFLEGKIFLKTADLSIPKSYVNPFVHCFYEWFVGCEKRIFSKFDSPDWEDICEKTLTKQSAA